MKNCAALSRTEGGFWSGTLEMRYWRSLHAVDIVGITGAPEDPARASSRGIGAGGGGYAGSQLNLTCILPDDESYAKRGRGWEYAFGYGNVIGRRRRSTRLPSIHRRSRKVWYWSDKHTIDKPSYSLDYGVPSTSIACPEYLEHNAPVSSI